MLIERFYSREQLEAMVFSHKDELGRTLYFPSGLLGPSYVIATNEQRERILRASTRRMDLLVAMLVVSASIISVFELTFLTIIPASILSIIVFMLLARRDVAGLERSQVILTRKQVHRLEMWRELIWLVGILGPLWLGLKLVTTLFPNGNPILLFASVVVPEMAVLLGIALWKRRKNT